MQSYANVEAELAVAHEEIGTLTKQNNELNAEMVKLRNKEEDEMKVANIKLEAAQKEIDSLKIQLNQAKDETDGVSVKQIEWAHVIQDENTRLRYELDRMTHALYRRDVELDDIHGRLNASRYYINYLQNRPEFQYIPQGEILPPDMRRKSSKTGNEKPKKRVHFAEADIPYAATDVKTEDVPNDVRDNSDVFITELKNGNNSIAPTPNNFNDTTSVQDNNVAMTEVNDCDNKRADATSYREDEIQIQFAIV